MKNFRGDLSDFPGKKRNKMYRLNRKTAKKNATRTMNAKIKLKAGILVAIQIKAKSLRSYNFTDQAQKWLALIPKKERNPTRRVA